MPSEVLGLIYAQTVVWAGTFFCPLLPLLNTAKFLLLFYQKKVRSGDARGSPTSGPGRRPRPFRPQVTLFATCSPASRTFRASTANFFFPLVLLLGLAVSAVPVLYSIFLCV